MTDHSASYDPERFCCYCESMSHFGSCACQSILDMIERGALFDEEIREREEAQLFVYENALGKDAPCEYM